MFIKILYNMSLGSKSPELYSESLLTAEISTPDAFSQ